MHCLRALLFAAMLLVLPATASAMLIISVSPSHGSICVAPGQYQSVIFKMFANSTQAVEMPVEVNGPDWMIAPEKINVSMETQLAVWAYPPKETAEGKYDASIRVCVPSSVQSGVTAAYSCLQPTLSVNVSAACRYQEGYTAKDNILLIIKLVIVIVAGILVFRMLRNTKGLRKILSNPRRSRQASSS